MALTPRDPNFDARVRASFARQQMMSTLGAEIVLLEPGRIVLGLPFDVRFTQQHGFMHAGAIASLADSACGYAAFSLMAPSTAVLSVEFKVNLTAPARGERFTAVATVIRPGKTLTVCTGEVRAIDNGKETIIAVIQGTMMAVPDRDGLTD